MLQSSIDEVPKFGPKYWYHRAVVCDIADFWGLWVVKSKWWICWTASISATKQWQLTHGYWQI